MRWDFMLVAAVSLALGCDRRARTPARSEDPPVATTSILLPSSSGVPVDLPSSDVVAAAMDRAQWDVRRCGPFRSTRTVVVTVGFAPSGEAVDARVFPPLSGTPQGACVQDAVRSIRLALPSPRAFEMTWHYEANEAPVVALPPPDTARESEHEPREPSRPSSGAVACGQLDPHTGLIRICFDRR